MMQPADRAGAAMMSFGDGHHRCPRAYIALQETDFLAAPAAAPRPPDRAKAIGDLERPDTGLRAAQFYHSGRLTLLEIGRACGAAVGSKSTSRAQKSRRV